MKKKILYLFKVILIGAGLENPRLMENIVGFTGFRLVYITHTVNYDRGRASYATFFLSDCFT